MDQLRDQFLIEGRELAQRVAIDLVTLERDPDDHDLIASVFRAVHTLKGGSALFDLSPMTSLLHRAEDLVDALRHGSISADKASIDVFMAVIAQIERWLDDFDQTGVLPAGAGEKGAALETALTRLSAGDSGLAPDPSTEPAKWALDLREAYSGSEESLIAVRYTPRNDCFFTGDDPLQIVRGAPGLRHLEILPKKDWGPHDSYDPFDCNLVFLGLLAASRAQVETAFRFVRDQIEIVELASKGGGRSPEPTDFATRLLRIPAERVDKLAQVVDELFQAKSEIAYLIRQLDKTDVGALTLRQFEAGQTMLDRLLASLHGVVTDLRLVPLSPLLRRFPVVAREIADSLGKQVRLTVQDEALEVDKSIVDGLFEPLVHLVRNAIDHGVESEDTRRTAGKPLAAVVTLSARRAGDKLVIELSDDGKGIDLQHIRRAAQQRLGLDQNLVASLTDQETMELLFRSGFSTAANVTEISGRGVGMDAVRSSVAALGGQVSIASNVGVGTTVTLLLPFRVVMTRLVTVDAGTDRFGVPIDSIIETVRLAPEQIQSVRHGQAFIWRDTVVPLFDLQALLRSKRNFPVENQLLAMVVGDGRRLAAFAVDRFSDRMDVVMRPPEGVMSGLKGIAGTTLSDDGNVLLVINPLELIR